MFSEVYFNITTKNSHRILQNNFVMKDIASNFIFSKYV